MARNRKRQRAPRQSDVESTAPSVATARARPDRIGSRAGDADDPIGVPQATVPGVTGGAPTIPAPVTSREESEAEELSEGGGGGGRDIVRGDSGGRRGGGGGDEDSAGAHPAPRPARHRNRLIGFLQGSWRELQRVQWPDQRQVVQATGVVIGFVIVAGAWLGVADWVATKIVNFIL